MKAVVVFVVVVVVVVIAVVVVAVISVAAESVRSIDSSSQQALFGDSRNDSEQKRLMNELARWRNRRKTAATQAALI